MYIGREKPNKYRLMLSKTLPAVLAFFAFTLFSPHSLYAQYSFSGSLTSPWPGEPHPTTLVSLMWAESGDTLKTTHTASDGSFTLHWDATSAEGAVPGSKRLTVYPNPFATDLLLEIPPGENPHLRVSDAMGRTLLAKSLSGAKEHYRLQMPGGHGLRIFTLTNNRGRFSAKAYQDPAMASPQPLPFPSSKTAAHPPEGELRLGFHSPGYLPLDTLLDKDHHDQLNMQLQPENAIALSGSLFSMPHNLPPDATLKVQVGDTTITSQNVQGDFSLSIAAPYIPQQLLLRFSAQGHHDKDTLVEFTNHEIHAHLQQTPNVVSASYELHAFDDLGDVEGAEVTVYSVDNSQKTEPFSFRSFAQKQVERDRPSPLKNDGDLLFSGSTNTSGIFSNDYDVEEWEWPGEETIRSVNKLKTVVESSAHQNFERIDNYAENLSLDAELIRLAGEESANVSVLLKNHPMNNNVANVNYELLNEHGESIGNSGTSNNNGLINANVTRGFEINENDTIFDYNKIVIPLSKAHHEKDTIIKDFSNIDKTFTLQQTQYSSDASLSVDLNSTPLNYAPDNVSVNASFNESDLGSAVTNEGSAIISGINYDYFQDEDEILRKIGGEEVTELSVTANHSSHENTSYTVAFSDEMTLEEDIAQSYINQTSTASGTVLNTNNQNPVANAQVALNNYENDANIESTTTNSNGEFSQNITYKEFTNTDNDEGNATTINDEIISQLYAEVSQTDYHTTTTNPKSLDNLDFGTINLAPDLEIYEFT